LFQKENTPWERGRPARQQDHESGRAARAPRTWDSPLVPAFFERSATMKLKSLKSILALSLLAGMAAGFLSSNLARAADKTYTNSIGMEFVLIPAGSFLREKEVKESTNVFGEKERTTIPERKVTISKPYYIGKYEVTQEQWYAVMGNNPSRFPGRKNPVERVSWYGARAFIERLNQKEGHNRYRLPTEAEWEYAATAGKTPGYYYDMTDNNQIGEYAWYPDNMGKSTHPVGQKKSNNFGLYDIFGNVDEWVNDWYGEYPKISVTDPHGPQSGSYRVTRGDCSYGAHGLREGYYYYCAPDHRSYSSPETVEVTREPWGQIGFRLVLSPGQ
jgi:formylglycine-generating enzyme required for sulfatase activity